MCPWGAPSSISRNSPPLLAALLLNSRRRSLPFFSFRPFPSRFPSVLADSVVGESRLASSERSNIGPGPLHSRSLLLLRLVVRPSFSPTRAATLSLSLSLPSIRSPLSSPLLSSPLFSSHPLRRTSSSSSFLLYSPAPSTVPLVPSSPFFLLSFLPVPTRHYLLSLAFVASPWQYRDDGRSGTESEKRKGPFSLALFPSMLGITIGLSSFFSFLFFRALCTRARKIFFDLRGARFSATIEGLLLSLVLFDDLSSLFTNEKRCELDNRDRRSSSPVAPPLFSSLEQRDDSKRQTTISRR